MMQEQHHHHHTSEAVSATHFHEYPFLSTCWFFPIHQMQAIIVEVS
jgi:hypothetical protein